MNFSKEQIEKAKSCKTIEELKELAKNEGLNLTEEEAKMYFNATRGGELNDDDLDKVAGGAKESWSLLHTDKHTLKCPFCGAELKVNVSKYRSNKNDYKYEWTPNICACGAEISYADTTMNFVLTKNGEMRIVESNRGRL